MRRLADVNVVFALLVEAHTHHKASWKWWEAAADGSVLWCLPVRLGVLRLLTNPAAMDGDPVSTETALTAWEDFARDERVVDQEVSGRRVDPFFRNNVVGRQPAPNLWTDAWLAAYAQALGVGVVSFDRDFRSFDLVDFLHLKAKR